MVNADGGTRTLTPSRAVDFESTASAIPPHPLIVRNLDNFIIINFIIQARILIFFVSEGMYLKYS